MSKLFFEEDCKGYMSEDKRCYVIYRDVNGKEQLVEVSKEVHDAVEEFRKYEKKQRNIDFRHFSLIHLNINTPSPINNVPSAPSAEDTFFFMYSRRDYEKNVDAKLYSLYQLLKNCTQKQRDRFCDHVIRNMTLSEISNKYGCTRQSVYESINQVYKKIYKKIK